MKRTLPLAGILLVLLQSCGEKRSESGESALMRFTVDSALVGLKHIDTTLGISFAAPRGWERIPESLLKKAERSAVLLLSDSVSMTAGRGPRLLHAWADRVRGSVITMSAVPDFDTRDSSSTLREYERFYRFRGDSAEVRTAVFLTRRFKVHQLLVITRQNVLFKMIFSAKTIHFPFQLDFAVPRNAYSELVRTIESVAGSVDIFTYSTSPN